jgi:hypothetical protein
MQVFLLKKPIYSYDMLSTSFLQTKRLHLNKNVKLSIDTSFDPW